MPATKVNIQLNQAKTRLKAAFAAAQQVDFEAYKQYYTRVKEILKADARKVRPKAPPKLGLPEPEVKYRPELDRRLSFQAEHSEDIATHKVRIDADDTTDMLIQPIRNLILRKLKIRRGGRYLVV